MKKIGKHNISTTGFKTPKDYFETLENNLISELNLRDQVSESGLNIPDGYLEGFKVELPKSEFNTKVINLFNKKSWLYVASVAAVIIFIFTIPKIGSNAITFASLDNDSIENYLLTNDLESVELSNLITNTTAFENIILEETLNDIYLEDYLYENIDVEDFNIE